MSEKVMLALLAAAVLLVPARSRAKGHDNCGLCHLAAEEGNYSLTIHPNYEAINPNTGEPFMEDDALCMRCHKMEAKSIHPVGIVPDPQRVVMPPEAVGRDGRISCASCHDVHESENYCYLRWPAQDGANISQFCVAYCHQQYGAPFSGSMRLMPYTVTRADKKVEK